MEELGIPSISHRIMLSDILAQVFLWCVCVISLCLSVSGLSAVFLSDSFPLFTLRSSIPHRSMTMRPLKSYSSSTQSSSQTRVRTRTHAHARTQMQRRCKKPETCKLKQPSWLHIAVVKQFTFACMSILHPPLPPSLPISLTPLPRF